MSFYEQKFDDRMYLKSDIIDTVHGFTSKLGGVSQGKICGYNFGFRVGDDENSVRENYRLLSCDLGFSLDRCVLSKQTHTSNIRIVTEDDCGKGVIRASDIEDTDGLITNIPNIALVVFAKADPSLGEGVITMTQISAIHTAFNIGTTIVMIPLSGLIIKIAMKVNGITKVETDDESQLVHLDKRMMSTPAVAVAGAKLETIRLSRIARENLAFALDTLANHDSDKIAAVKQKEGVINKVCDSVSEYLVELCSHHLSDKDSETVTSLLNTISDIERIGDHAENIAELAEEMTNEGISFSEIAMGELHEMSAAMMGAYDNAIKAMEQDDVSHAVKTAFLEQQVNKMEKDLRQGHINRLSNAECSVSAGVRFLDLLGNLERVSDHAMNIAQVVLNDHRTEKNYHSESFLEEEPYV